MSQLYNGVILACVCVCLCVCASAFASSDALDDEEVDALCEVGHVVLIQTKLSATQGLLSNDRGASMKVGTVGSARNDAFKIAWFIFLGLWMLGAIAWQLSATTQTLSETTSKSSATPETSESVMEQSATLQAQHSPTSTSSRDTSIDEVKFHLMTLVFFAHLLIFSSHFMWFGNYHIASHTVHVIVKSFHMPAFVMLSGMFSKSQVSQMQPERRQIKLKNMTVDLLGAFLMTSAAAKIVNIAVSGQSLNQEDLYTFCMLSTPPGPWYILSIFWYRLVWCPISTLLDPRARIPAAIFFAVGCTRSPTMPGSAFALSRTMYHLPFFQMGLQLSEDDLNRFSGPRTACASFLIFFFALPLLFWQTSNRPWISLLPEGEDGAPADKGGAFMDVAIYGVRSGLSVLALGLLLRIAQIGLTTETGKATHSMLAGFGRQTLYAYLLQMTVLLPVLPLFDNVESYLNDLPEIVTIPLLLLLAVMFNILFSMEFSKMMFWWMCQPSYFFSAIPPMAAKSTTITHA